MDLGSFGELFSLLVKVLGFLVLLTGAIGGVYQIYKLIRLKFFAPRIKLFLPTGRYYTNRRDPKTGTDYQWAELIVKNPSKSELRNCRAYLRQMVPPASSNSVDLVRSDILGTNMPLRWTDSGGAVTTDLLGGQARVELFRFHLYQSAGLEFSWDKEGRPDIVLPRPGTYYFEAICIADGCRNGKLRFKVSWSDKKKPPAIEKLNGAIANT